MAIADHLSICTHCRQEAAQLSDFMATDAFLLPQEQSADVSSSQSDRTPGSIRILIATLIDRISHALSTPSPALVGLRGQEASQQVFQIDDIQIILDVQPAAAPSDHIEKCQQVQDFFYEKAYGCAALFSAQHSPLEAVQARMLAVRSAGRKPVETSGEKSMITLRINW